MAEEKLTESKLKSALRSMFSGQTDVTLVFLLICCMYLADIFLFQSSFVLHPIIIMSIYLALGAFVGVASQGSQKSFKSVLWWMMVAVVAGWGAPYLLSFVFKGFGLIGTTAGTLISNILARIPYLPFVFYIYYGNRISKAVGVLFFLYIVIVLLIIPSWTAIANLPIPQEFVEQRAVFVTDIQERLLGVKEDISAEVNRQLRLATGDYYTGKVDENAQRELGVRLEEIKLTESSFFQDQKVSVFATMKAETLDETVNVSVGCFGNNSDYGRTGAKGNTTIFPSNQFSIAVYETIDIDCEFEKNAFDPGVGTVSLTAEFPFKTLAYIKTYFMDQTRLRELRRANVDPLDQYGVYDKNPIAVYTNGPVKVGMGLGTPPVGIDLEKDETTFTVGVTVENQWQGKIKSIDRIILLVPVGFELQSISGEVIWDPGTRYTCADITDSQQDCDDELYTVYILKPAVRKPIKNYISFRARVSASKEKYELLLGGSPLATRFFKTTVEYTYFYAREISVNIKKVATPDGITGATGPAEVDTKITEKPEEYGIELSFHTNKPLVTWYVLYDINGNKLDQQTIDTIDATLAHSIKIDGLDQGTKYQYEIWTRDFGKDIKIQDKTEFTTVGTAESGETSTTKNTLEGTYEIISSDPQNTQIQITANQKIFAGTITLKDQAGTQVDLDRQDFPSGTLSYTSKIFSGLDPNVTYQCTISITNADGETISANIDLVPNPA